VSGKPNKNNEISIHQSFHCTMMVPPNTCQAVQNFLANRHKQEYQGVGSIR